MTVTKNGKDMCENESRELESNGKECGEIKIATLFEERNNFIPWNSNGSESVTNNYER